MNTLNNRNNSTNKHKDAEQEDVKEKEKEKLHVQHPNTIVNPWAVVIHF